MALPRLTVKCTTMFGMGGNGWTESFWWAGLSEDLQAQTDALGLVAAKRRLLLGKEASIRAIRCSFETGNAGEDVKQDSFLEYIGDTGYSQESADFDDSALLLNWKDASGQRSKFQFLRGIWDKIVEKGGGYDKSYGNWETYLQAWYLSLATGVSGVRSPNVGWLRQVARYVGTITGYTTDSSGYTTLTLAQAIPQGVLQPTFTGFPYGQPLESRVAKLNTKSPLNGQLLVSIIDATHVRTVKPVATIPFVSPGKLTLYERNLMLTVVKPPPQFISIYAQKIVERKVGAPLLESRGRARARVRA